MHHATETDHLSLMYERLRRLHASMRARGASEAAIARLPKLPSRAKPLLTAPVLLARPQPTDQRHAAAVAATKEPPPIYPRRERDVPLALNSKWRAGQTDAHSTMRAKAITGVVAAVAQVEGWQLSNRTRSYRFVKPRQIAQRLIAEFVRLSPERIGPLFEISDRTTVRHNIRRVILLAQTDVWTRKIYDESREAIIARWPEYQAEQTRNGATLDTAPADGDVDGSNELPSRASSAILKRVA